MKRPTDGLYREVLPNGVTLLVQQRTAVPGASLVAHVRAGFLDEPESLVGVSHVLEHMLFKGTPTMGPGELAQRTKALGGALNAYTSYDRTVYYASAPSRTLTELAALQADQVRNSVIDADELRRELGVIIQEARRKLDTPGAVAGETLHELLYDQHRIRRWRIGQEAMLEQFTRDDITGYYHSRYVPSRVIVSLVSDIAPSAAAAILREAWGDWRGPIAEIPAGPVETSQPEMRARRMSGDVVLTELVLGWRGPGELHADVPALDVAATILGSGRGSRFARALRDPGLVNGIGVSNYGVVDTGIITVGVELDAGAIDNVLPIVLGSIAELGREAPTAAEFARAVTLMRASSARRLERYESRAIALADAEAQGDVTRLDRELSDLLAVTPAQVSDAVQRWMPLDRFSAIAYLPGDSTVKFDVDTLTSAIVSSATAASTAVKIEAPVFATAPAPALITTPKRARQPLVHHVATGSFDILAASFGDTGQTSLSMYQPRLQVEGPENAGLAALAVRSMLRGTTRLDAEQLAFAMESLGGGLSPSLGADLLGFGANVLSEHVGEAVALLGEVLYAPRFDADALAIERQQLSDDARAIADDMVRFPMQLALGVAFNDRGYGAPSLGTPESLAAMDSAVVRRWHDEVVRTGRTTIVVVGDGDAEQLVATVSRAVEPWQGDAERGATAAQVRGSLVPVSSGVRSETRARQQSALAMLFPGPDRHAADRFAAEVWSGIAGGLGGRLFESLRSARSLAYTVMASSWQRRRAGGLITYIAMNPDRLDEARDAMLEELAKFRDAEPTEVEVSRARAMLIGEIEMARQTAGALAGEIAEAWLLGDGLGDLDDPAAPYRSLTAADVHAVAARYLDPAARAEGIVMAGEAD